MASTIIASLSHPSELIAMANYWASSSAGRSDVVLFSEQSRLPAPTENNYSYAKCYFFLNKTSRSFARVIQSLDVELRHPIAIFYLVLRGLDTIEDDMTLDPKEKDDLLRNFYTHTATEGWNYDGNGRDEKDAILLQGYEVVVKELNSLKPAYIKTILDITKRMGNGMADFCAGKKVVTMEDYNLYTHYVAGLVGLGLNGLFIDSGLESKLSDPKEDTTTLANEMGLFLQKVNILKDFLADSKEGRLFWPENVWGKHVSPGAPSSELAKPENKLQALACLNELCADALQHIPHCLEYMSKLENPTVFHFCAIPQVMALATFSLFFNNYNLFTKSGTKIRRGLAVKLIQEATDMHNLKTIYFNYIMDISYRARAILGSNPADKSFNQVALACANTVKWIQIDNQKLGTPGRDLKKASSISLPYGVIFAVLLLSFLFFAQLPVVI